MQTEKRASSQGATWGLGVLFGVVGASIQQSVGGFVIGAVVGALCAQILFLRTRTESLEKQIRELAQRLAGLKAARGARGADTEGRACSRHGTCTDAATSDGVERAACASASSATCCRDTRSATAAAS